MSDILDGLAKVHACFRSAGLESPTAILLGSHEEGMRFLSCVRQQDIWLASIGSAALGTPVQMSDGSSWMEVKVMGIFVRWPANRVALPDGRWAFA